MANLTKNKMIEEIILVAKASQASSKKTLPLDELLLSLVFKTESELVSICYELNIKI